MEYHPEGLGYWCWMCQQHQQQCRGCQRIQRQLEQEQELYEQGHKLVGQRDLINSICAEEVDQSSEEIPSSITIMDASSEELDKKIYSN